MMCYASFHFGSFIMELIWGKYNFRGCCKALKWRDFLFLSKQHLAVISCHVVFMDPELTQTTVFHIQRYVYIKNMNVYDVYACIYKYNIYRYIYIRNIFKTKIRNEEPCFPQ